MKDNTQQGIGTLKQRSQDVSYSPPFTRLTTTHCNIT